MPRTSADARLQAQRQRLVNEAMQALNSSDSRARRWSIALAARYRRMIAPCGVYSRAAKFSELREALKKEGENARELALRILTITGQTQTALSYLLRPDQQKIDNAIWRRYEIGQDLKLYADEVERLVKLTSWPKGGDLNLAKTHLGSPKQWLVGQCLKVFFQHSDTGGIRPLVSKDGSPFGDYVGAIYELGTGEEPWVQGVGLSKIIDNFARQWRRNTKQPNRI
jgi:hypothetical protein